MHPFAELTFEGHMQEKQYRLLIFRWFYSGDARGLRIRWAVSFPFGTVRSLPVSTGLMLRLQLGRYVVFCTKEDRFLILAVHPLSLLWSQRLTTL